MTETAPSSAQIAAEWTIADPAGDSVRWWEGISRYEAGSLDDGAAMEDAARLMCAALVHYVADGTLIGDIEGESPETALEQTIWNVLVATLHGGGGQPLSAGSAQCLRLALAAARQGGYQAEDLGGSGVMAEVFDDDSRGLMIDALSGLADRPGEAPVELAPWFTGQVASGAAAVTEEAASAESRWGGLRKRAQDARQHINPLALQHGIDAIEGALTEARVAKRDKTGKLKIRKFGVATAALRPSKTVRRAVDGAALPERLKAYNQQVYGGSGEPAMAKVAGWYADPAGQAELRYWDGSTWTDRTKDRAYEAAKSKPAAPSRPPRQRSEICVIDWTYISTRATDRRTRKDYPYEMWFVANALGPNGLYQAAESSTFNSSTNYLSRNQRAEASFNELVKKLWADGWEPTSGGGRTKLNLWYEYRFRRPAADV